jgi:hypothetical protein
MFSVESFAFKQKNCMLILQMLGLELLQQCCLLISNEDSYHLDISNLIQIFSIIIADEFCLYQFSI